MQKIYITLLILVAFSINIYAQTSENKSDSYFIYGLMFDYRQINNQSSFSTLPGAKSCCPQFKDGTGYAQFFSGLIEYTFSDIGIGANFGYSTSNGDFVAYEPTYISINSEPYDATFEHKLNYNLSAAWMGITLRYYLFDNFSLSLGAGADYYITSKYNQYEKIIAPSGDVTFLDKDGNNTGRAIRNELSGEIPDLNKLRMFSSVGLGYNINLTNSRSVVLRPEVKLGMYFDDMVKNVEWKSNFINVGISILFSTQNYIPTKSESELNLDLIRELIQRQIADSLYRIEMEERLRKELAEKEALAFKLEEQGNIIKSLQQSEIDRQSKLKSEQDEISKRIAEENAKAIEFCKCYILLYTSTEDKLEAETLQRELQSSAISDVEIVPYFEPYLKTKYYRVQSKCFENPTDAFDERAKSYSIVSELGISPQIICNR